MNGRRSQYRGGHFGAPVGGSKWTHKDDRADNGKGINEDMCIIDKGKAPRAHCETYNCYDTWKDSSSAKPCTPDDQRNNFPFLDPHKQAEFEA